MIWKIFYQIVGFCWDDFRSLGVPHHQVCVGAHSHTPLPGVAVEDLGSVGAGHRHEIVLIHLPGDLGRRREGAPQTDTAPCLLRARSLPVARPVLSHWEELPDTPLCPCGVRVCTATGLRYRGRGMGPEPCPCGLKDMRDRFYFPWTPKLEVSEKQDLHWLAPTPVQASQGQWRGLSPVKKDWKWT